MPDYLFEMVTENIDAKVYKQKVLGSAESPTQNFPFFAVLLSFHIRIFCLPLL